MSICKSLKVILCDNWRIYQTVTPTSTKIIFYDLSCHSVNSSFSQNQCLNISLFRFSTVQIFQCKIMSWFFLLVAWLIIMFKDKCVNLHVFMIIELSKNLKRVWILSKMDAISMNFLEAFLDLFNILKHSVELLQNFYWFELLYQSKLFKELFL